MEAAAAQRGLFGVPRAIWWIIIAVVGLIALLYALVLPFVRQPTTSPPADTTVTAILDRPADFSGRTVTVVGALGEEISPRAFTLTADPEGAPPDEVLVVVPDRSIWFPEARPLDNVQVTGEVRQFERETFERELGLTFDEQTFGRFEGQPVILAHSVFV